MSARDEIMVLRNELLDMKAEYAELNDIHLKHVRESVGLKTENRRLKQENMNLSKRVANQRKQLRALTDHVE